MADFMFQFRGTVTHLQTREILIQGDTEDEARAAFEQMSEDEAFGLSRLVETVSTCHHVEDFATSIEEETH